MKTNNLARIAGAVVPVVGILVSGCGTITGTAKGLSYLAEGVGKDLMEMGQYGIDRIDTGNNRDSEDSNERVRIVHVPSDEFDSRFKEPYSNVTVVEKEPVGASSPTQEYNQR